MLLAHDINTGYRTKDVKITENVTFETMLLAPQTLQGLKSSGFYKPSPIQLYGIPIGKCGFDLLLEAKSGTGKTAVFSIIALEKIDFSKGLQVIILSPTREIAAQTCDVLRQIGSNYRELQVAVVMGGLPVQNDKEKFKKPVHIVVGSPGRLRHLIHSGIIDIKSVRLLVLDEADKLMENSFQSDIKFIHSTLPTQKQVIMSSATYPKSSTDLINSYVQNANHVCPDSDCVLLGVDQKVSIVNYNTNIIKYTQWRYKELQKILGRLQFKQCLVFCNYQVRVEEIHKLLKKAQWPSQKLYGQQQQLHRLDALKTLQQYKCRILVSTDLAARGIDASNIDLVVNFEPPCDWQTYLHRIGRAGRFGSYGLAITILSEGNEEQNFQDMFKSMDLPINITHLWTNKHFDLSGSVPDVSFEVTKLPSDNHETTTALIEKEPCQDIWKMLCGESDIIDSIETIETQCELSQSSEIETFAELMISLENHNCQDIEDDTVFKHIELNESSNNKCTIFENYVKGNSADVKGFMEKDTDINGSEEKDTDINESEDKDTDINVSEDKDTDINGSEEMDTDFNGSEEKEIDVKGSEKKVTDINESNGKFTAINGLGAKDTDIIGLEENDTDTNGLEKTHTDGNELDENYTDINESDEKDTDIIGSDEESTDIYRHHSNEDNINGNRKKFKKRFPDFSTSVETAIDHIATYQDKVDIQHDASKSLLNSGLPIMFSSSKLKNHGTKHNTKIIPDNNYYKYNSSINNYKSYRENEVNAVKRAEMFAVNSDTEDNMNSYKGKGKQYMTKLEKYEKTNNYYEKQYRYHKENHMQQQKFKLENRIKQTESAKAYNNWYNQLKMKMQHIEQVVYINEMCKF